MDNSNVEADIPGPEHSGKWIAWDDSEVRIVACAETLREVIELASAKGIDDPVLELVPRTDCYFIGLAGLAA